MKFSIIFLFMIVVAFMASKSHDGSHKTSGMTDGGNTYANYDSDKNMYFRRDFIVEFF